MQFKYGRYCRLRYGSVECAVVLYCTIRFSIIEFGTGTIGSESERKCTVWLGTSTLRLGTSMVRFGMST